MAYGQNTPGCDSLCDLFAKSMRKKYELGFFNAEISTKRKHISIVWTKMWEEIKGMSSFEKDMGERTCLLQLKTWFQVSDYCNFWNNERCKPYNR